MSDRETIDALTQKILQLIQNGRANATINTPQALEALARSAARIAGGELNQGSAEQRSTHAKVLGAMFAQTAETLWTNESQIWPDADAAHN